MQPSRETTSALPPIALVGAGRVGGALARAAAASGVDAVLADRSGLAAALAGREVTLLCVPDTEIEGAAEAVVTAASRLRMLGHTSGATGLGALAAGRDGGAATFSLHPLQTVPDAESELIGSPAAVAGSDAGALALARRLAEALGMRPFEVPEESRAAYHAAASIASNFLVALEESAATLLAAIGVDEARELLAPLVLRTAANWAGRGGAALTGPIARGDEDTVAAHIEAIASEAPELAPLYRALAERTRELAALGTRA